MPLALSSPESPQQRQAQEVALTNLTYTWDGCRFQFFTSCVCPLLFLCMYDWGSLPLETRYTLFLLGAFLSTVFFLFYKFQVYRFDICIPYNVIPTRVVTIRRHIVDPFLPFYPLPNPFPLWSPQACLCINEFVLYFFVYLFGFFSDFTYQYLSFSI